MNKWAGLGAVLLVIVAFVAIYFSQDAAFDEDVSLVDPITQTMTLGAMRVDPKYVEDVTVEDNGFRRTEKGVRAKDVMNEANKQILTNNEGKFSDEVILTQFRFTPVGGEPLSLTQSDVAMGANPVVSEVNFIVEVYNKESFIDGNPNGALKDGATPLTSTQYEWGVFTDAAKEIEDIEKPEVYEGIRYDGHDEPSIFSGM